MSIVDNKALKLYAKNGINVLLEGHHGVGKTAVIKEVFNNVFGEINKDWLYFSGSTMDAWTNFVGCPKTSIDNNGLEVLDIVPPKAMAYNTVKAIFIDEYNRAPKAVRNAVMELLQFKSVNGRSFSNLQVVWGAVNPLDEEETYDVEALDPAQQDRFEIQIKIPYQLNKEYLTQRHGDIALAFIDWWTKLPDHSKSLVSPRRLDKAIFIYGIGGNLNHVFDKKINTTELLKKIKAVSIEQRFNALIKEPVDVIKAALNNPDTVMDYIELLSKKEHHSFIKYVNKEFMASSRDIRVETLKNYLRKETAARRENNKKQKAQKIETNVCLDEMVEHSYDGWTLDQVLDQFELKPEFNNKLEKAYKNLFGDWRFRTQSMITHKHFNYAVNTYYKNSYSSDIENQRAALAVFSYFLHQGKVSKATLEKLLFRMPKTTATEMGCVGAYRASIREALTFLSHVKGWSPFDAYCNAIIQKLQ